MTVLDGIDLAVMLQAKARGQLPQFAGRALVTEKILEEPGDG